MNQHDCPPLRQGHPKRHDLDEFMSTEEEQLELEDALQQATEDESRNIMDYHLDEADEEE